MLLAGASFWSFSIARGLRQAGKEGHRPWFALGLVIAFVCIDELCHVHETLDWILKTRLETSGAIAWPWVIPYAVLALTAAAYFLPFYLKLDRRYQWIFGLAGVLYVSGAIGLEMAEAAVTEKHGEGLLLYGILYTIEENLEILAVLLTNWGMTDYLIRHCGGHALTLKVS
ncbi:MAG: hypothetical protein AAGB14_14415 [Verrucomicrobiota bacterium]